MSDKTERVEHTPGPWNQYVAIGPNKEITVLTVPFAGEYVERARADAFLIAAAPDLLDALRDAERLLNHMGDILNGMDCVEESDEEMATPIFAKVEAAIAKATGAATPTGDDR